MISLSAKTKGWGRLPSSGRMHFLGRQKFVVNGVARRAKILLNKKQLLIWPGSSKIDYMN